MPSGYTYYVFARPCVVVALALIILVCRLSLLSQVTADSIPVVKPADGISAKVIVGQVADCKSLITPILKVQYLDFMCEANSKYEHALDAYYETCIVHVYRGAGTFGASQTAGKEGQCLLFGPVTR